jgi:hypothetical protein
LKCCLGPSTARPDAPLRLRSGQAQTGAKKKSGRPVGMTDWEKAKSFNIEGTEEAHRGHREGKESERWILGLAIIRG